MKGVRRLLIALGVAALILIALGAGVVMSGRSLVIIENRGDAPVDLSIESTHAGDFAWSGSLAAKQRVIRTARFTADGGVVAVCRDVEAIHRTTGGYVTTGWPHRVDVVASNCGSVRIDAARVP
ncbi:hypothetical protein [Brevundimonas sp. Root1279]|uniref:hypothetical protein n=1 Tax=Brevundimonas sp. Root1279 TaxID=1736443 RepID=UPI0006F9F107|nr:hypothetical protein [Brevundimonas sp. Root1279]KQW79599.1 hypothetical protein ASC65_13640 [Brevundimonas sp. Root1279]